MKWMVSEGMADKSVLRKSPPRPAEDRLMTLVAGIHSSNPELTLREIASQLERLHALKKHIEEATDFESVRNAHNVYLAALTAKCYLNASSVRDAVKVRTRSAARAASSEHTSSEARSAAQRVRGES